MFQNKALYWASLVLVLIGGIDLGVNGLLGHSLLQSILGGFARLVFILIGLGAIFLIIQFIKTGGMKKAVSEVKHDIKDIKPEAWKKDDSQSKSDAHSHKDDSHKDDSHKGDEK